MSTKVLTAAAITAGLALAGCGTAATATKVAQKQPTTTTQAQTTTTTTKTPSYGTAAYCVKIDSVGHFAVDGKWVANDGGDTPCVPSGPVDPTDTGPLPRCYSCTPTNTSPLQAIQPQHGARLSDEFRDQLHVKLCSWARELGERLHLCSELHEDHYTYAQTTQASEAGNFVDSLSTRVRSLPALVAKP